VTFTVQTLTETMHALFSVVNFQISALYRSLLFTLGIPLTWQRDGDVIDDSAPRVSYLVDDVSDGALAKFGISGLLSGGGRYHERRDVDSAAAAEEAP